MINRFELSRKARIELLDSWVWYEEQRDGLGDLFKDEVHAKIKFIQRNPELYPIKGEYRQAPLDTFPFLIVYQIRESQSKILIVSIFHTSRYPKRKK
jgi:plasmid stabilization system protein ParE